MSITPTTACFWLNPQTGQCHDATNHEQWLVENAALVGLQASVLDLDPDRDADELHLIGIRSGLVRISHNGKNVFVQYHAGPAQVKTVEQAVCDFLRNHGLPPLQNIRIRNSLSGDERTLSVSQFRSIVDRGGRIFPKSSTMSRLFGLIACHVALGWVFALARNPFRPSITEVLFYALVLSEAALLGLWFALIERPEWRRPLLTIVGLVYLTGLSYHGPEEAVMIFGVAAITAFHMAVFRFAKYRLYRLLENEETPATVPLQFSIRQMMALTAACALLFTVARTVRQQFDAEFVSITIASALVPSMAAWATLTRGRLWLKVTMVLAVSALPGLALHLLLSRRSEDAWVLPTFTVAEAVISFATLLVVRSKGYRLLRIAPLMT